MLIINISLNSTQYAFLLKANDSSFTSIFPIDSKFSFPHIIPTKVAQSHFCSIAYNLDNPTNSSLLYQEKPIKCQVSSHAPPQSATSAARRNCKESINAKNKTVLSSIASTSRNHCSNIIMLPVISTLDTSLSGSNPRARKVRIRKLLIGIKLKRKIIVSFNRC